jgi:hypothetical protein
MSVPTTNSLPLVSNQHGNAVPAFTSIPPRTRFTGDMQEKILAFCMGMIKRLGMNSLVLRIGTDICMTICVKLLWECIHADAAFQHLPIVFRRLDMDMDMWDMAVMVGRAMMHPNVATALTLPGLDIRNVYEPTPLDKLEKLVNMDDSQGSGTLYEAIGRIRIDQHEQWAAALNTDGTIGNVTNRVFMRFGNLCRMPVCNGDGHELPLCNFDDTESDEENGDTQGWNYPAHFFSCFFADISVRGYIKDVLGHIARAGTLEEVLRWVADLVVLQCCVFPVCDDNSLVNICNLENNTHFMEDPDNKYCAGIGFIACHEYGRKFQDIAYRNRSSYISNVRILKDGMLVEITFKHMEEYTQRDVNCDCSHCTTYGARYAEEIAESFLDTTKD